MAAMPNNREPTLRQKSNGAFFARWGGKDHYLSTDEATARRLFCDPKSEHPGSLAAWRAWRAGQGPLAVGRIYLVELAEMFFMSLEGRDETRAYYRKHLARFLHAHGAADLIDLTSPAPAKGIYIAPVVPLADALGTDMARRGLGPKTIRHDQGAIKRLITFGASRGLCPSVSFSALPKVHVPPSDPRPLSESGVRWLHRVVARTDPPLAPWIAVNYLCACRPIDTVRIAQFFARGRFGAWHANLGDAGRVLELKVHKTAGRGHRRFVLMTPEAIRHAALLAPLTARLDGYSSRARRAGVVGGPSVFRDSAASHLRLARVEEADVRLILGHSTRGALRSYAQAPWPNLLGMAARLTLIQAAARHA